MKILVAGASGLIGGEVVRLLKERGLAVASLPYTHYMMSNLLDTVCGILRNRGKTLFLLGIVWKRQQLRTEAFPTLSFGCVSEIPRKIERPSGPTVE